MDKLFNQTRELMIQNRRTTKGHTYTVPSPETYPYQWLWDSCFNAIILGHFDIPTAKEEIKSLLTKQFENGMIPHMIYWEPGKLHTYKWGRDETSTITQPPIIADAIWQIFQKDGDKKFLTETYDALCRFYNYLAEERDPDKRHLIGIINPDESGEDNSPRFDQVLKVESNISEDDHLKKRIGLISANKACDFNVKICMREHFWVDDVPFNSLYAKNLQTLSEIALVLDRKQEAEAFATKSEQITKTMRALMWQDGAFWPIDINQNVLPVSTWAHFAPMFAGQYSNDEAAAIVKKYLAPEELLAPFGIRTVSKKEKSYDPQGFWRGPIWLAAHWFIYKSLMKYNFRSEANTLREQTAFLLEKNGFREYFNPETGEGYGADNFTWGGLIIDMN